ncbi:hypothetical protein TraAM80_10518, partial [Trypanosoma rangeli]
MRRVSLRVCGAPPIAACRGAGCGSVRGNMQQEQTVRWTWICPALRVAAVRLASPPRACLSRTVGASCFACGVCAELFCCSSPTHVRACFEADNKWGVRG